MKYQKLDYKWFGVGDINGFFGLMFDNIAVLSFLAGTLILGFKFPADVVYTTNDSWRLLWESSLVTLSIHGWLSGLQRKVGAQTVTAMPLGLDTPSTIGLAITVLGPVFIAMKQAGETAESAAIMTWHIGMATMVMIGVRKVIMSFAGNWVQKVVPRAGLPGSLAGVGLALIGFIPLVDIFGLPVVGMLSLGLMLYTLVARASLPGNIPGILVAITVGTIFYHLSQFLVPHP